MPDKFIVNSDYSNTRFDRWFKQEIINIPNSLLQRLLRTNKIKVNNKKVKSSLRLNEGDKVLIFDLPKIKPTNFKNKIKYLPTLKEAKTFEDLVIYDSENYIVINKPRGIAVQSGSKNLRNIVDTFKKTKYFKFSNPFIVHRLDKETSGVFLLAKNRAYAQFFTSLFRLRKIHKTYLAIVRGEVSKSLNKMEDHLSYFDNNKKITHKAITYVKILKSNSKFSFLELNPQTGRKHQLRKQLFLRGYPIVGDTKYKLTKNKISKDSFMLLHSFKLKFMKNDKKYNYQASYDKFFKKKLNLYFG